MANKLNINIPNIDFAWQANKNYTIRINSGIAQEVGNNRSPSAVQTLTNAIAVGNGNFLGTYIEPSSETLYDKKSPLVVGGLTTSTAQAKFGNSSFAFNGSQYLRYMPFDVHPWNVQIPLTSRYSKFGPWTTEVWFKRSNTSRTEVLWDFRSESSSDGPKVGFSGTTLYVRRKTGSVISATPTISTSSWYHIAVMFDNTDNSLGLYLNGTLLGSATIPLEYPFGPTIPVGQWNNNGGGSPLAIGAVGWDRSERFLGYMDDFRHTGAVVYNKSGFTPPSSKLASTATCQLLLQGDTGLVDQVGNTSIYDETQYTSSSSVVLNFSEYIKKNTGNFTITNNLIATSAVLPVSSSSVSISANNTLTITGLEQVLDPSIPINFSTTNTNAIGISFPSGIIQNRFSLNCAPSSSYDPSDLGFKLFNPYFSCADDPDLSERPEMGWEEAWFETLNGQTGVSTTTMYLRVLGPRNLHRAVSGKNFYIYKKGPPDTLIHTIASTSTSVRFFCGGDNYNTLFESGPVQNFQRDFKTFNFIRIASPWSYSSGDTFYLTVDEGAFETTSGNKTHPITSSTFLTFTMA